MSNPMKKSVAVKGPQIEVDYTWMAPGKPIWVEQLEVELDGDAFLKGVLTSVDQNTSDAVVQDLLTGKSQTIKAHRVHERAELGNTLPDGFADMVNMEILNDAELMENVRMRFMKDLICTYVGPTLLVVNPFKKLPQAVGEELRMSYIKHIIGAKNNPFAYKELAPHVYALASEAYRSLFENNKNQSIVISGESGAGKTENAKFAMSLLTSIGSFEMFKHESDIITKDSMKTNVIMGGASDILKATLQLSRNQEVSIEDKVLIRFFQFFKQILSCNPILEAFGNSKTKKNNNSSRFGKYVRMAVDKKVRKIKGADIVNYLLEKSRVTTQGLEERNFHIFYHLYEGLSMGELGQLELIGDDGKKIPYEWFEFLKKSENFVSPGIDDIQLCLEIRESFEHLGMRDFEMLIFQVVSAVLLLGNLVFDSTTYGNNTPCTIKCKELLFKISKLLQIDGEKLAFSLTHKNRKIGTQVIDSPLPEDECLNGKDSLAKELYERLFNWLVVKLNENIKPKKTADSEFVCVGLLDIYGFEVFKVNSFEQLMINYTNEKLHQLYIFYCFKEEEKVFVLEGLGEYWGNIQFKDNTSVIELMEKHPIGVFNLLDESCSIAADDLKLLDKIRSSHKANPLLVNPKAISNPTFIIVHTAKDVEYNINGFRAKNKDETSQILLDLMEQSGSGLVKMMFTKLEGAGKADKYLGTKVRKEMGELMKELNSCDVHFIRCLKPNEYKKPNIFVQTMTLNQIRYLGVLDSLKVRKDAYPIRRTFDQFYKQFGDIGKDGPYPILVKKNVDFKVIVSRMVDQFFKSVSKDFLLMGNTKVFMRQKGLQAVQDIFLQQLLVFQKQPLFYQRVQSKNSESNQDLKAVQSKEVEVVMVKIRRFLKATKAQASLFHLSVSDEEICQVYHKNLSVHKEKITQYENIEKQRGLGNKTIQ